MIATRPEADRAPASGGPAATSRGRATRLLLLGPCGRPCRALASAQLAKGSAGPRKQPSGTRQRLLPVRATSGGHAAPSECSSARRRAPRSRVGRAPAVSSPRRECCIRPAARKSMRPRTGHRTTFGRARASLRHAKQQWRPAGRVLTQNPADEHAANAAGANSAVRSARSNSQRTSRRTAAAAQTEPSPVAPAALNATAAVARIPMTACLLLAHEPALSFSVGGVRVAGGAYRLWPL